MEKVGGPGPVGERERLSNCGVPPCVACVGSSVNRRDGLVSLAAWGPLRAPLVSHLLDTKQIFC